MGDHRRADLRVRSYWSYAISLPRQTGSSEHHFRETSRYPTDPRGIALDDDGIRLIQGLGLYNHIFTEIGSCEQHHPTIFGLIY